MHVFGNLVVGSDDYRLRNFYQALTGDYDHPKRVQPLLGIAGEAQFDFAKFIKQLCEKGERIQAIKLAKTLSGMGLKESKDWVEQVIEVFPSSASARLFR